ncbi:MAG: D-2-hydroxyacid dehydrogenase family protein [Chloroflexi bacterium]|nr:D-2-hydroxyacid dehydrogenase family protein [Chloroflexota bacterium]
MKVAILDDYHHAFEGHPSVERLRARAEVDIFTRPLPSPEAARGYQALIALRERTRFDAAFFAAVPGLELIAQTGHHAYHIDLAAATRAGVLVATASSASGTSTAELTLGLMLAAVRRIPQTDHAVRQGSWPLVLGRTLRGKRLGILGLGRVGTEVAQLAQAFGMEVLAWGPTLTSERAARHGVTLLPLDEVLERADNVSVHLTLSDQSRGLLDEARLRRMGPHTLLVNTARGAIVDEAALARVLEEGALGGAALDVFVHEPLAPSSPLCRLDNVVLTAHLGWPSDATYGEFAERAVAVVEAYLDGRPVQALNPRPLD